MISSLKIEGYRCFEHFEMTGLGRVNLLVGKNNSGKTSVLEAIYLLMSHGSPAAVWNMLLQRFETVLFESPTSPSSTLLEADPSHLFNGHQARTGSRLALSAMGEAEERHVSFTMAPVPVGDGNSHVRAPSGLMLGIEGDPQPPVEALGLSPAGGIGAQWRTMRWEPSSPPVFVAAGSLSPKVLFERWDRLVLTPAEEFVLKALRFIDPGVERIAPQVGMRPYLEGQARGGFIVKRRGIDFPVPIGSMGGGMWRLLALAISITQSRGGVLLVDEIETGLHHSVMTELWQLILNAAKEFDVQVFATTHSFDCVESLARANAGREDVTVQRIEAGKRKAVPYDDEMLKIAAEHHIEVR